MYEKSDITQVPDLKEAINGSLKGEIKIHCIADVQELLDFLS